MKCPICNKEFQKYEGMLNDARGVPWCKPCTDEHDSIDWDEIAEKRMEERGY